MVKNLPPMQEPEFNPWVRKIPWRKEWQPTPVFLPGESHGQRSLVGYSPWGRKETNTFTFTLVLQQLQFQENHTFQPKPSKTRFSTQLLCMEPLAFL